MSEIEPYSFRFIDLFAGIGGIRLALEDAGGQCVMTSEIDKWARKTYRAFFKDGDEHLFNEDITKLAPANIPSHDVLAAGFPCQPFSLAGVSKKNALGRAHGFDDPTQGTLFFDIKEILSVKRPSAFLLENVKNLRSHDKGNTWRVIEKSLDKIGYIFTDKIIDAARIVPQHRERVFIIGFDRERFGLTDPVLDWSAFWNDVDNELVKRRGAFRTHYNVADGDEWPLVKYILEDPSEVPDTYTLTPNLWRYLQEYKTKHRALGNGFGHSVVTGEEAYTRTISARYYKDGSEALVSRGEECRPRRLTPLECARLQGFPETFQKFFKRNDETPQPVSDMQAYKQFGNSVCVPVVESIVRTMTRYMREPKLLAALPACDSPTQTAMFS